MRDPHSAAARGGKVGVVGSLNSMVNFHWKLETFERPARAGRGE